MCKQCTKDKEVKKEYISAPKTDPNGIYLVIRHNSLWGNPNFKTIYEDDCFSFQAPIMMSRFNTFAINSKPTQAQSMEHPDTMYRSRIPALIEQIIFKLRKYICGSCEVCPNIYMPEVGGGYLLPRIIEILNNDIPTFKFELSENACKSYFHPECRQEKCHCIKN